MTSHELNSASSGEDNPFGNLPDISEEEFDTDEAQDENDMSPDLQAAKLYLSRNKIDR